MKSKFFLVIIVIFCVGGFILFNYKDTILEKVNILNEYKNNIDTSKVSDSSDRLSDYQIIGVILKEQDGSFIMSLVKENSTSSGTELIYDTEVSDTDDANITVQYDENTKCYYANINSSNNSVEFEETDISNAKIDSTIRLKGNYINAHTFVAEEIAIVRVS